MSYKYLFGPVPSRRLGISLGVDVVPSKVCNLNCVYCEVGKTTKLTVERKEYILLKELIKEIDNFLSTKPELDYITFSGAGEPTLNIKLGEIIKYIKSRYSGYKIAVITNGTLLDNKEIRNELLLADVVLPSLDSISQDVFIKINRPGQQMNTDSMIKGLRAFRKEYNGKIWLEIFLVQGINDTDNELKRLKKEIININPDKIHLNTLDRPGTEKWVKPVSIERMMEIKEYFQPFETEIVSRNVKHIQKEKVREEELLVRIIDTAKRRPMTLGDLAVMLNIESEKLDKLLLQLMDENKIISDNNKGVIFYKSVKND